VDLPPPDRAAVPAPLDQPSGTSVPTSATRTCRTT
jgi:hypothetical protein